MFALLRALPFLTKIVSVLVFIAALGGSYAIWRHTIYQQGRADEKSAVENQNRKANDAVRTGIKNIDDCYDRGGVWDSTRGLCQ